MYGLVYVFWFMYELLFFIVNNKYVFFLLSMTQPKRVGKESQYNPKSITIPQFLVWSSCEILWYVIISEKNQSQNCIFKHP